MPNIQAKIQATRLLDEVEGTEAIRPLSGTQKHRSTEHPPLQGDGMVLIENDVESLFPSIMDVEAARMAQIALERSELDFDGFDIHMALRYLRVVGGRG